MEIDKLQKELHFQESAHEAALGAAKNTIVDLKRALAQKNDAAESSNEKQEDMRDQLEGIEGQMQYLMEAKRDFDQRIRESDAVIFEKESELEDLQQQFLLKEKALKDCEHNLDVITTDMETKHRMYQKESLSLEEAKKQVLTFKDDLKRVAQEKSLLYNEVSKLQQILTELKATHAVDLDSANTKAEKMSRQLYDNALELKQRSAEYDQLYGDLNEIMEEVEELRRRDREMQEGMTELDRERRDEQERMRKEHEKEREGNRKQREKDRQKERELWEKEKDKAVSFEMDREKERERERSEELKMLRRTTTELRHTVQTKETYISQIRTDAHKAYETEKRYVR